MDKRYFILNTMRNKGLLLDASINKAVVFSKEQLESNKELAELKERFIIKKRSIEIFKGTAVYFDRENGYIGIYKKRNVYSDAFDLELVWYKLEDADIKGIIDIKDIDNLYNTTNTINAKTVGRIINSNKIKRFKHKNMQEEQHIEQLKQNKVQEEQDVEQQGQKKEQEVQEEEQKKQEEIQSKIEDKQEEEKIEQKKKEKDQKIEESKSVEEENKSVEEESESKELDDIDNKKIQNNNNNDNDNELDFYIKLLKLLHKGNRISIKKSILNSMKKLSKYPVYFDSNLENMVSIIDLNIDSSSSKTITIYCVEHKSSDFLDIEILKQHDNNTFDMASKQDFKDNYLKWRKETLYLKV